MLDGLVPFWSIRVPRLKSRSPSVRSGQAVLGPFKTKSEPEAGGGQTPKAA